MKKRIFILVGLVGLLLITFGFQVVHMFLESQRKSVSPGKINETDVGFVDCISWITQVWHFEPLPCTERQGLRETSWRFELFLRLQSMGDEEGDYLPGTSTELSWDSDELNMYRNISPDWYCVDKSRELFANAVVGKGTGFGSGIRLRDASDDLVILIEARRADLNWIQPGDFSIDEAELKLNFELLLAERFKVGFADGSVWELSKEIGPEELRKQCLIETCKDKNVSLNAFLVRKIFPPDPISDRVVPISRK